MRELIVRVLMVASLLASSTVVNETPMTGYIFLGDSRTVGMDNAIDLEDDSTFVVAKVGEGYKWMVNTGLPAVLDIIEENEDFDKWVLITNLGVNDLHNAQKYADAYEDISELFDIYVVSVNPCKGSYDNLNSAIESFNEVMKGLEYVTYIDTYSTLRRYGFSSKDGLHYDKDTYKKIYDIIIDTITIETESNIND